MKKNEQTQLLGEFQKKQTALILSKGDDYSGEEDRLSNFKKVAAICGLPVAKVVEVLIALKVVRVDNLLGGKNPAHESLQDSLLDLANYAFLMSCVVSPTPGEEAIKALVDAGCFTPHLKSLIGTLFTSNAMDEVPCRYNAAFEEPVQFGVGYAACLRNGLTFGDYYDGIEFKPEMAWDGWALIVQEEVASHRVRLDVNDLWYANSMLEPVIKVYTAKIRTNLRIGDTYSGIVYKGGASRGIRIVNDFNLTEVELYPGIKVSYEMLETPSLGKPSQG